MHDTTLYFSGLKSNVETRWLELAQVQHVLVDPADAVRAVRGAFPRIALDSGAYRCWRQGEAFNWLEYEATIGVMPKDRLDFFVAPDIIGGTAQQNLDVWKEYRRSRAMPVWHFGEPHELLLQYLAETQAPGKRVGVGALVPLMREKDRSMLKQLTELAAQHGPRLHIFGCCWITAINALKGHVASMDTSKFIDGARYGSVIFIHDKTRKLHQAPMACLGKKLTREERCVESAIAMDRYLNGSGTSAAATG